MNVTTQPQTYTDLKNKNFIIKLIVLFAVIPAKAGIHYFCFAGFPLSWE